MKKRTSANKLLTPQETAYHANLSFCKYETINIILTSIKSILILYKYTPLHAFFILAKIYCSSTTLLLQHTLLVSCA